MTTSTVVNRIYARSSYDADKLGRIAEDDVEAMAPDLMLLRALKPPTASEGSALLNVSKVSDMHSKTIDGHPARACAAYEVVRMPVETTRGNPLDIKVGDVLVCFNAALDPLMGNDLLVGNMHLCVQMKLRAG